MMNTELEIRLAPHEEALYKHCLKITKSAWDAEDLKQETLIRVCETVKKNGDRELSRAYLNRIATNLWIDGLRKKQVETRDAYELEELPDRAHQAFDVREAFELLADRLSPLQMTLVLMLDIFGFTARETAELIQNTEGAVKEGVKRARRNLQQQAASGDAVAKKKESHGADTVSGELLDTFLRAFRQGNPRGIYDAYNGLRRGGLAVVRAKSKAGQYFFYFRDPDGHLLCVTTKI